MVGTRRSWGPRGLVGLGAATVMVLGLVSACIPDPPPGTTPTTDPTSTTASTTTTESTTTTTVPETSVGVNTFADTDDGTCDESHCSLREAIALVDSDPTLDTVELPAGTYVIGDGSGAGGALRAAGAGPAATPGGSAAALGPNGEAFRTTSDLTIAGAGAGSTTLDLSGDDHSVGWIAEASLTLRDLTVRNLGSGTSPAERMVVVGQMAEAGEQVGFDGVVVEDVQPDMAFSGPSSSLFQGGMLVAGVLPGGSGLPTGGTAFDVVVQDSTVRHVARNWTLVQNWGGSLDVIDSTIEDTPPLAGALDFGSGPLLAAEVTVQGSTLTRMAGLGGFFSSCLVTSLYTPGGATLSPAGSSFALVDSTVTGELPSSGDAACAGQSASLVPPVRVLGPVTFSVERSLLVAPAGQANLLGALSVSATLDQNTGVCTAPDVSVVDSTLWSQDSLGLVYQGCNGEASVTGSGVSIVRSTVAGLGTFAQPNPFDADPGVPAVTLQGSVVLAPWLPVACGALNSAGAGMVVSLGNNTAPDASCALTAAGDEPSTDPLVGPLQDNGGPSFTAAPLTGSPLIDTAGACTGSDQRGVARPQGVACDRGAVELEP